MNKRLFVVVLSILLIVSMLGACGTKPTAQEIEKNVYQSVCWDLKGTIGPDGKCVLPQATSKEVCGQYNEALKVLTAEIGQLKEKLATIEANKTEAETVAKDKTCLEKAKEAIAGIPAEIGMVICGPVTNSAPAQPVKAGEKVDFGSITFDAEHRVWILSRFIVPNKASYPFDYTGRAVNILNAPFVTGAETNPVNGQRFKICFDTAGECTPPAVIQRF